MTALLGARIILIRR